MKPFDNYQSPFSWRYASPKMRKIWSEVRKREIWRAIWVELASVQSRYGLVTNEQVAELEAHKNEIDVERALAIEAEIHHDLMAELKTFASQCPMAGGILHMGATSMDIEDNADAIRLREALDVLVDSLEVLLLAFADQIERHADLPIIAYTHIQPAEPSTLGYRLSLYAQDLREDLIQLRSLRDGIRGKGFKGAVGTAAAYADLIGSDNLIDFENALSSVLDLRFYPISSQTYPRKQDLQVINALSGLGASLYKFAFDLRLLQSPPIGELSEPFGKKQVGSSAMPFKRNPINAEKIDSLARQLSVYPQVAWQNAANSLLERTLDDSANRRTILPEAFLICDELLKVTLRLVKDLDIRLDMIENNLEKYAPFAATERVLMKTSKRGADRQEMHEHLRSHALAAWQAVQSGKENPLIESLMSDEVILEYISTEEICELADVGAYVGNAPQRALDLVKIIREELES